MLSSLYIYSSFLVASVLGVDDEVVRVTGEKLAEQNGYSCLISVKLNYKSIGHKLNFRQVVYYRQATSFIVG